MKIRKGFVSNSSSTSFIVKFPRAPKTVDDVRKMLFGDATLFFEPYGDGSYPTTKVAQTVFSDIQEQSKNNIEGAIELLSNSHNGPDYENFKTGPDWKDIDWDAHSDACKKWAEKELEEFYSLKKIRKDKLRKIEGENVSSTGEVMYIFEYSDNSGSYYSALEHGGLFKDLEHITISQH